MAVLDYFQILEDHGYEPSWDGRVARALVDRETLALKFTGQTPSEEDQKDFLFKILVGDIASLGEPFSGYSHKWVVMKHPDDPSKYVYWKDVYE